MKSYTDLERSKRLAEILPLESVDTWWAERYAGRVENYEYIVEEKPVYYLSFTKPSEENYSQDTIKDIPCWSLAALLELLPKRIEIVDNVYELSIYLYGIYYWNTINGNLCFKSKDKDNLVDACYETIVFLHEQKLL